MFTEILPSSFEPMVVVDELRYLLLSFFSIILATLNSLSLYLRSLDTYAYWNMKSATIVFVIFSIVISLFTQLSQFPVGQVRNR